HQKPGLKQAKIGINDHPITFDDELYFSYQVADNINVQTVISDTDSTKGYVKSVFKGNELFTYSAVLENNIDYNALKSQDLIILKGINAISTGMSQEFRKFIERGGSILVFPAAKHVDKDSYNAFLKKIGADQLLKYFK
ncbi:MAG: hypothetical protein ABEH43_08200, partial [Flavobacteriales bacterium]